MSPLKKDKDDPTLLLANDKSDDSIMLRVLLEDTDKFSSIFVEQLFPNASMY